MAQGILSRIETISKAIQDEDDRGLLYKEKFDEISRMFAENKEKISSSLSREKIDKFYTLLSDLGGVLQGCKTLSSKFQHGKQGLVSKCNPFKSTSYDSKSQELGSKLKSLLHDVQDILSQVDTPDQEGIQRKYEWTTSFIDETKIYGWTEDANKIVDSLTTTDKFTAIGIVGVYGSGKTTLTQKVFVNERINDAYPLKLWVCVGQEEKKELLYRMLDNLGEDANKIKEVVEDSEAVKNSSHKESSRIGVLLFILHAKLLKTGYLIVFDDIRAHDDWYKNLTLEPPKNKEWNERLAYGLPKANKSAVIVTCRREEHAQKMVRAGKIYRPPKLETTEGWRLFEQAYKEAKKEQSKEEGVKEEEDKLFKELEEMKGAIVKKCLGLPIALIEAAKEFATLQPEAQPEAKPKTEPEAKPETQPEEKPADN